MIYSAAIPSDIDNQAFGHLARRDGQEDLCFAIWYPSQGATRRTALIHSLIMPLEGERTVHGNVEFTSDYYERALDIAQKMKAGLAFMHSHPATGWQGMSRDDIATEQKFASSAFGATNLPLVGITVGTDNAWSARFWVPVGEREYKREWCETVRAVGDGLAVTYYDQLRQVPEYGEELLRTISVWGTVAQSKLARLRVGVVGLGSVGSLVAEALARMGIGEIVLIDFDIVKRHNLDRLLHATREDANRGRRKIDVMADALKLSATSPYFNVVPLDYSIVEEEGFRAALDCDVLFSCVDRPWPRNVLNSIAYAHLIPVIDGGVFAEAQANGQIRGAAWYAHVAAPGRRCLECLGQYTPEGSALEQSGMLDDPVYIKGMNQSDNLLRSENVFTFSMSTASMEVLHLLSMVVLPEGFTNQGAQCYDFLHGELSVEQSACKATCLYPTMIALGDSGLSFVGRHEAAEIAREKYITPQRPNATWWKQIAKKLGGRLRSFIAKR